MPDFLTYLTSSFPWYTDSPLYWYFHTYLQMLSAIFFTFGYGDISSISCFIFSWLQLIRILRDVTLYNNHEYMYSTLAFAFGLCEGHDAITSPLFISIIQPQRSGLQYIAVMMICVGIVYMMCNVAVYGIPGMMYVYCILYTVIT